MKRGERPAQSQGVVSTHSAALAAVWGESATRCASAAHARKGRSVTLPTKRGGGPAPRGGSNVPREVAGGQGTLSAAGGVGTPAHFLLRAPQLAGESSWAMLGLGGGDKGGVAAEGPGRAPAWANKNPGQRLQL